MDCKCNKFKECKIILITLILSLVISLLISLLICIRYSTNNKTLNVLTAIAVKDDNTRNWDNYYKI